MAINTDGQSSSTQSSGRYLHIGRSLCIESVPCNWEKKGRDVMDGSLDGHDSSHDSLSVHPVGKRGFSSFE
jgi:hypothetical protein